MTRQEKKAYIDELATMAAKLEADWNEELKLMEVRFSQEQLTYHKLADAIRKDEGQDRVDHICRMMKKSQQERYEKAANAFLASYNAVVLEYKRAMAEFEDPTTLYVHQHSVC